MAHGVSALQHNFAQYIAGPQACRADHPRDPLGLKVHWSGLHRKLRFGQARCRRSACAALAPADAPHAGAQLPVSGREADGRRAMQREGNMGGWHTWRETGSGDRQQNLCPKQQGKQGRRAAVSPRLANWQGKVGILGRGSCLWAGKGARCVKAGTLFDGWGFDGTCGCYLSHCGKDCVLQSAQKAVWHKGFDGKEGRGAAQVAEKSERPRRRESRGLLECSATERNRGSVVRRITFLKDADCNASGWLRPARTGRSQGSAAAASSAVRHLGSAQSACWRQHASAAVHLAALLLGL